MWKFDKSLIGHFQLRVYIEWFIMSLSNFMCLHFLVKIKYCGRTQLLAMGLVCNNFECLYLSMCCLFVFHVCFKCQVL